MISIFKSYHSILCFAILVIFYMINCSRASRRPAYEQMEKTSRVLYLWRREVEEQREKAADIRHRNEQLVYNILPPHVATHFMGLRRKKHEELYSQSYEEVGVLFASMPNYSGWKLLMESLMKSL